MHGLDQRPLAQKQPVRQRQELVLHVLPELRDELQPLRLQERAQGLADVALIAEELAPQVFDHSRHGAAVVHVAGRQVAAEHLTALADDEVELKAVEPAHRGLPPPRRVPKDFVPRDAQVVADRESRGVHERDARTVPEARVEVAPERRGASRCNSTKR